VGFELYCQLLKQSVSSIKGERVAPRVQVPIRFDWLALSPVEERTSAEDDDVEMAAAFLPLNYIPDSRQRVSLYRKIAETTKAEEIDALRAELKDRFGPLPEAVELLLQIAHLRLLAAARKVTSIEGKGDKLMLMRNGDYIMAGDYFPRLLKKTAKGRLNEVKRLLLAIR
jgi:transcription-repair coupling factor (superfamily II helicase)